MTATTTAKPPKTSKPYHDLFSSDGEAGEESEGEQGYSAPPQKRPQPRPVVASTSTFTSYGGGSHVEDSGFVTSPPSSPLPSSSNQKYQHYYSTNDEITALRDQVQLMSEQLKSLTQTQQHLKAPAAAPRPAPKPKPAAPKVRSFQA